MSGPPAVSLVPGVWRIPTAPFDLVNTIVFRDDDGQATLVDTGTKGAPKKILAGLAHLGIDTTDVTRIIATHAHSEHVGGLGGLRKHTGTAPVAMHSDDADFVRNGVGTPLDQSTLMGRLLKRNGKAGATPVEEELTDGQVIDVAGGLRVLHTPGHSPGHIALLHEPTRLLITGDSIFNAFHRMTWSLPIFCTDIAMNKRTAHVLGELDYDVATFTHGPEIRDSAREAVRGFIAAKQQK